MPRCLIIPDVHLHYKMFDRADGVLKSGQADMAIQMGDLVDDWGEEFNVPLYDRTLARVIKFHEDHPGTLWVMGNHDYGYHHPHMGVKESGHSRFAEVGVLEWIEDMEKAGIKQKIMHLMDNVIFTHAGLTDNWVRNRLKIVGYRPGMKPSMYNLVHAVNNVSPEELWREDSPIWARPQQHEYKMYGKYFQVVGHTPVRSPIQKNNLLSTDTFSTYQDGRPFGDGRFVIVDTKTKNWRLAEEDT